jgi:hypothetical protein
VIVPVTLVTLVAALLLVILLLLLVLVVLQVLEHRLEVKVVVVCVRGRDETSQDTHNTLAKGAGQACRTAVAATPADLT